VAAPGRVAGLGVALVIVSYSYQGWNAAVYIGGEVAEPRKNLPRALVLGTVLVTTLYLGLNAVFVLGAPASLLAGKVDVGRITALVLGGPRLAKLVSALIAFVLANCISALAMAGPQITARMAADGSLPRVLAVRPGRPPRVALLAQTAIAIVALWTAAFASMLTYVGFTLSLMTAATVLGLVWNGTSEVRPWRFQAGRGAGRVSGFRSRRHSLHRSRAAAGEPGGFVDAGGWPAGVLAAKTVGQGPRKLGRPKGRAADRGSRGRGREGEVG